MLYPIDRVSYSCRSRRVVVLHMAFVLFVGGKLRASRGFVVVSLDGRFVSGFYGLFLPVGMVILL